MGSIVSLPFDQHLLCVYLMDKIEKVKAKTKSFRGVFDNHDDDCRTCGYIAKMMDAHIKRISLHNQRHINHTG